MTVDPHLVALLGLPKLGPKRLRNLLGAYDTPERAWSAVAAGRVDLARVRLGGAIDGHAKVVRGWQVAAALVEVDDVLARHQRNDVSVLGPADPDWPDAFRCDPEPPPLAFVRGDLSLLTGCCVAIVGTRRCTSAGASVARELGHDLAAAGVGVVSGLALGIDGAAHRGSLAAAGPTIGVVATGLDVVYPRRHLDLWEEVGATGLLLGESPLGTGPERWRFPARNRLIAALAHAVVVVESPRSGGSMLTVESAIERQTDVLAVPGPVRARTSDGPNQLLVEGCAPVRDATDVLVALGSLAPPASRQLAFDDLAPEPPDDPLLQAISWPPCSLDHLVEFTGLPFAEVAARLADLELAGAVQRVPDGYQRDVRP